MSIFCIRSIIIPYYYTKQNYRWKRLLYSVLTSWYTKLLWRVNKRMNVKIHGDLERYIIHIWAILICIFLNMELCCNLKKFEIIWRKAQEWKLFLVLYGNVLKYCLIVSISKWHCWDTCVFMRSQEGLLFLIINTPL